MQENEYGVVSVVNHSLYCMLCHHACKHTLHIEQLIESEYCPESLEELSTQLSSSQTKASKATSPAGISWKKTPFLLPRTQQSILRKGALSFLSTGTEDIEELIIPSTVEPQQCPACRSVLQKFQVALPLIFERSIHKGLGKVIIIIYLCSYGQCYTHCCSRAMTL
jgi:hypothetical protein